LIQLPAPVTWRGQFFLPIFSVATGLDPVTKQENYSALSRPKNPSLPTARGSHVLRGCGRSKPLLPRPYAHPAAHRARTVIEAERMASIGRFKKMPQPCYREQRFLGSPRMAESPVARRTSVEMIEKYYAAHIKTNLDAASINIMRPKPNKTHKTAVVRAALPSPLSGQKA
jgi:hypothetical protein